MIKEFKFKSSTGKELYAKKWYDEKRENYKVIFLWLRKYLSVLGSLTQKS